MEEFAEFHSLKMAGQSSRAACRLAKSRQFDFFQTIRMLRAVFDLSLFEAKAVIVTEETGAASLDEYQANLLPALADALDELEAKDSK